MWSKGSRRTGGAPSGDLPFALRRWPLKPKARVPSEDPNADDDAVNPARDRSSSGGASSGSHGRGQGPSGCDTSPSTRDITADPNKRTNSPHCDDGSEPHVSGHRDEVGRRGVRGLRSGGRRAAAVEQPAA
ncbi:hypothetical protein AB0O47_38790, partial [Streptomyces noursei]